MSRQWVKDRTFVSYSTENRRTCESIRWRNFATVHKASQEPPRAPRACKSGLYGGSRVAALRQIRYAWSVLLYDAHNHLQDERLAPHLAEVMAAVERGRVVRMVVNGSCEKDWPAVLALVRQYPQVFPSFGYHPWYVKERTEEWKEILTWHLDQVPSAVGEIGLDRWIEGFDLPQQEEVFTWQMQLAAERNLPATIHCLKAWGRLLELLETGPRPARGFLLHSYGGPSEMTAPLAKLGAYFSFPGYFAHERKLRQRETFRYVPPDRLLIETDAPDQLLPENLNAFPLTNSKSGEPINHPANLVATYQFLAGWLNQPVESLAARVEENFLRLFGDFGKGNGGTMASK